jgi:signal transduction histidine kinase
VSISKKEKLEIINSIFHGLEEYWINSDGIILATNLEAITITGYEEVEMIGKHFSVLYTQDAIDQGRPQNHLQQALRDGSLKVQAILVRKTKIKFVAKIHFETLAGGKGENTKMTIQDRTYTSVQKTKMKRLESHFNSLFHNHFIGVLNIRQNSLQITQGNIKASEILGEYDLAGKNLNQYIGDIESLARIKEILLRETSNDVELPVIRKDTEIRWVRISHSTFSSEELTELLLVDITEDKKRIGDLERINQQLDQFIYHISHDLRSPVTTLLGLINLSKKEDLSIKNIHGYIELMRQRTMHLDSILLDLTSIVLNEKTSLDLEKFNVENEIKSITSHYNDSENRLFDSQLEITQDDDFITDVKRLRIILRNLISNAVKYQSPAQLHPRIRISTIINSNEAFFEIEDNGIGIHPQYIDKVFDMFFRATDKSSGSGLGLYIVKSLVDKLQGRIFLTSIPEKGSLFKIILPNKKRDTNHRKERLATQTIL